MKCKSTVLKNHSNIRRAILANFYCGLRTPWDHMYSKGVWSMVCFLLPRCKCHPGCIQAQRPAGRASWPAALCTSSLLHIWMYLGSTTNHQRPKIQPMAQFFCCAAQTNVLKKSIHVDAQRICRKGKNTGREERRRENNLRHFGSGWYLCGWE